MFTGAVLRVESSRAAKRASLVRDIFAHGWNEERFDEIEGHLAQVAVFHYNGQTNQVQPRDLPATVARWRVGFPDLHFDIHELVAAADLVAIRLEFTGTHLGPWSGLEPSGRRVRVAEMMMFRFEGEQIVEMWETFDEAGLRRQIDATFTNE